MADSTEILEDSSKIVYLHEKSHWKKICHLKKNKLPLRQFDDFSEEEKVEIFEKNSLKKRRPKSNFFANLGKKYHTSRHVIDIILLSLSNMIVLDEWTNSDSEPELEIPVKTEPKIIVQNCFQDKQQPGSEKQAKIKKKSLLMN